MRVALVGLCGLCACTGTPSSAPKPQAVAPSRVAAGSAVSLTINGADFFADVLTDFRRSSNSAIGASFTVRLSTEAGESVLADAVTLVDPHALTAEVPALYERGLYDVTVIDPSGRSGTVAGALRVVTSAESVAAFMFDFIETQRAGVPFAVGLTAVDEVGHAVDGFDGTAQVSAPGSAAVTVGPFARGRARGFVTVAVPASGVVVTAEDALSHSGASDPFDVTPGEPAQVAFVAAPDRMGAGACGGPFTLEVQDMFGNAAAVAAASPFTVAVNPPEGGELFSDAACATTSAAGMLQGRSSFWVRSTRAGRPQLRVVPEAWPSATREVDVDAGPAASVAIASAPQVLTAGMCSQPVVVQTRDAFGNPAPLAAALPLDAVIEPATAVTFHDDGTCAAALNAFEIAAGSTEARLHFRSAVAGMLRLSVDAGSLGFATQGEEVTP